MRILVAYAGKNGSTQTCVNRLRDALKGKDVTVVCLERETVEPSDFDLVVFGSSVYFGKMRPAARKFLAEYENVLLQKRLALFLCCALEEEYDYYCKKFFSPFLREQAFQLLYFGGSLKTDGLSFFDKLAVRAIRSSLFEANMDNGEYLANLPAILPENVDKLATYIREEILHFHNG